MNRPRSRPRVLVRARDPALRALLVERLSAAGDVIVESALPESGGAEDTLATIEVREESGGLSPREQEVLALLADGLANKEIASFLGLSAHTAKFHVESILRKLSSANRAEAVKEGIRRGIVSV